jgi:hypothetical protein
MNKLLGVLFLLANINLTIGSVFFFPPLNNAIVGNWLF